MRNEFMLELPVWYALKRNGRPVTGTDDQDVKLVIFLKTKEEWEERARSAEAEFTIIEVATMEQFRDLLIVLRDHDYENAGIVTGERVKSFSVCEALFVATLRSKN